MTQSRVVALTAVLLIGSAAIIVGPNAASGDELLPGVEVDSTRYRAAVAAVAAAEEQLEVATHTILESERFLDELRLAEQQLSRSIPGIETRRDLAEREYQGVSKEIGVLAQEFYVLGDTSAIAVFAVLLNSKQSLETHQRLELFEALQGGRILKARTLQNEFVDAEFAIAAAKDGLATLRSRILFNDEVRTNTIALRDQLVIRIPILKDERALSRRIATVRGTDFQLVTLDAYRRAAANASPGCNLHWSLLAGIGRVESRHGRFAGRTVLASGDVSEEIIGIALNGENSTLEILDTDGGVLDGDQEYDRAVGPMQFIPTTWAAYASDGNGDGRSNPQNIYDSTAAAASYLCRSGDLSDSETRSKAIRRYNNSEAYVASVLGNASDYAGLGIG